MSESCKINVERRGDVAVFWTDGYINNQGGEEIRRGKSAGSTARKSL